MPTDSQLKGFFHRSVFFLGWLLSPFTFWNDAFINIPLSYICASLAAKILHADFLVSVLVFYWASNITGVLLMYACGKSIIGEGGSPLRKILGIVFTVIVYSLILVFLYHTGLLKPPHFLFNTPSRYPDM